ncbi:MAG TPA: ribonuclease Y [bacterium]
MSPVQMPIAVIIALAALAAGVLAGWLARRSVAEKKIGAAESEARTIVEAAEAKAATREKEAALEAKEYLLRAKADFEKETREKRQEFASVEKRLDQKEENLERKVSLLDRKESDLNQRDGRLAEREKGLGEKEKEIGRLVDEAKVRLERVAGMTAEQARRQLLESLQEEVKAESARTIRRAEEETRLIADKKAKEIISTAIQRYSSDYVAESTVSVVPLPSEEMKGRIIGREGRNIRTLEAATGVDLIIDDTPEAVILSAFDPVRRQIAKISLERLIADGRIHPARIEEVVEKVKKETDQAIREAGEQAMFDLGVHNAHQEIVRLIGRLKYRTSYAQNILKHSREVAYLCGIMAAELGLNVKLARRAGLLHDIGKALDHETEGPHAIIGAEVARRYEESEEVINAIASHHEEEEPRTVEAVLVAAADALSAARPGARREVLEAYVKRMEKLEEIADSFRGVEKAFAIQAGREIRIMVQENQVSDGDTVVLARDIARKIEEQLTYPGQIRVTVIREKRAVDYAK